MSDPSFNPTQSFEIEIKKEIRKRIKYTGWDFKLAHSLLWISIIASFCSSIIIASNNETINKIFVAIIAGIPGLVIVIDKTFDFAKRSAWDVMYTIDLQELKNDYDFGKIDAYTAAQRLQGIIRRNEALFLKIGFFSEENRPQDKADSTTVSNNQ